MEPKTQRDIFMGVDNQRLSGGKNVIASQILMAFQTWLMMLCGSWRVISFWGIFGDISCQNAKMHFHNFHGWHFLWYETISECTPKKKVISMQPGNLHFIWLNDIFAVLFSCSTILKGCEIFKWRVRGRESNAWKHGAFCFLTASRDKVEIWL